MKHWLTHDAGVTSIKMVSEILLLMASDGSNVPSLISKGCLSLMLDLKSAILSQSTETMLISREALLNLAQASAKLCIRTNPAILSDATLQGAAALIFKYLFDVKCHHELL